MRQLGPASVAGRLYWVAVLYIATIAGFAVATVSYAMHTSMTVKALRDDGMSAASRAADVELRLERHRRITESAPSSASHQDLAARAKNAEQVAREIMAIVQASPDLDMRLISEVLPVMTGHAQNALTHRAAGDTENTATGVRAYSEAASRVQDQLRTLRIKGAGITAENIGRLVERGDRIVQWIIIWTGTVLLCIWPLSTLLIRSIVARLKAITVTMRRLAGQDTGVKVPSLGDGDEIGEMARALEVFKSNAVALLSSKSEMEKLNYWLEIALNNMSRGLSMFDADRRLIICNRAYRELYGLPHSVATPGTPLADIASYWADRNPGAAAAALPAWCLGASFGDEGAAAQRSEIHALGDGRVISVSYQSLGDGGWVDVHEDVTDKRRADWRITQLAHSDTLTGIANRHFFMECLESTVKKCADGRSFAVLWLDLDRFKEVNDTHGHPAGDALLKQVSERLTHAVRRSDLVARLGGDEFAIIQRGEAVGEAEALALAGRIANLLSEPFPLTGQTVSIGVSIGIAIAPAHGTAAEGLIRNADIALYHAKANRRGSAVLFQNEFEQEISARRQLEADLRAAIACSQLELYYQPIVSLPSQAVVGCEALMRWRHPVRGMVPPSEFIPLAEETGLIASLGRFALHRACREAASWPAPVKVAVNLSADQFMGMDLVGTVRSALSESGLAACRLELEVTESLLLQENARTSEVLHALRAMGISIALDDFGTGYASLSYLRSFPFDKIKIDQTFVRDLPVRPDCVAIVRAVSALASTLGMKTVAEGVETAEHLSLVTNAGCDEAQGYLICRPVPASELARYLLDRPELALRSA